MNALYIAWQYMRFNKAKTATLIGCISLIVFLPLALEKLLGESEAQLLERATSTPLVVGAKGSALDLMMNTLYFGDHVPEQITLAAAERIEASELALPIPLYVRFRARGFPVVGTSLDYFDYRALDVAQGRQLAMLGDCVIGASVADRLDMAPGEALVTSPENLFDLAGVYPLKMKVVGVLETSHSPDDLAIFVDLKTAWVIQGLGHGHEDMERVSDPQMVLGRDDSNITASPKLFHYTEITEANLESFHFHGDLAGYPITAVIAAPYDTRSGTILQGRYVSADEVYQMVQPQEVISELLENIFRIKSVLDAVISVVGVATLAAMVLVFALSWRLREREWDTIFKLGCSRLTMLRLLAAEIGIILVTSAGLCVVSLWVLAQYSNELVRALFVQ